MSKLKDHIIKQEEHSRLVFDNLRDAMLKAKELNHAHNNAVHQSEEFLFKAKPPLPEWQAPMSIEKFTRKRNELKHQSTQTWGVDMPDLEGKALADAEKQFDYDSWLGEHGIGE
jgi:hypothetical protein